ncbi:hypothetical protein BDR03DRAFT_987512 [Suillus americanus]|nr:hypothetical protein BDR03DRAFT_987512 [Suillus americanus]
MGIPGLWERVASAADNRTLKQLAVSELKTEEIDSQWKVKLFKIGIDASAWMHSMCAVFQFNHAGAGKLPELRTLFFWLGILLKLPLHVVFVFDGLKHLPEKGHVVQNSPHWLTCDFQHMLELFGFQWTEAPGEAKAELATMNAHGVIDAAMTEDCNILIFGAPCIIRSAKKDKDYLNIEVYSEDGLEHAGGDYDEGVSGCGIKITHKVAQQSKIGQEMLHAFLSMAPEEFSERAKELVMELHSMLATDPYHFLGCRYSVPLKFPRREVISKYVDPITAFSATRSSTLAAWDALSCQPHLADLADFCRVQFGWDDDAIIERMYGGIWEGAYLHTLCKLPQHSDQAHAQPTFKVISQSTIMALWCNIEVYNIKVDSPTTTRSFIFKNHGATEQEFSKAPQSPNCIQKKAAWKKGSATPKAALADVQKCKDLGIETHLQANNTRANYAGHIQRGRQWLASYFKTPAISELERGDIASDDLLIPMPSSPIPNRCSHKVLALFMSSKGFHENLTFKKMWDLSDGDTYRGTWHFDEARQRWEGNPADSADVYNVLSSIKHMASAEGGDCTHSMAMIKDYMDRVLRWHQAVCLLEIALHMIEKMMSGAQPSDLHLDLETRKPLTQHLEQIALVANGWTLWTRYFKLIKLQRKDIMLDVMMLDNVLKSYLTNEMLTMSDHASYFEIFLSNWKGWQKKVDKGQWEVDLRSNHYKIYPRPEILACDNFFWMLV